MAKYQVFVSSTYEDLKDERDAIIRTLLTTGHIPIGMELFSAADENQWTTIKRNIEESDYYVVIVAHRYGSTFEGISYTRREYEYADKFGIPVLGFVIANDAPWPDQKYEHEAREDLNSFKALIQTRTVEFWHNKDELSGQCAIALQKAIVDRPSPGWVRGSLTDSTDVTVELSRLSQFNAELQKEREMLSKRIHDLLDRIAADESPQIADLEAILTGNVTTGLYKVAATDEEWKIGRSYSLRDAFDTIAPFMSEQINRKLLAEHMAFFVSKEERDNKAPEIFPFNYMQDILFDLEAVGLVERANVDPYWSLSEQGQQYALARRLERLRGNVEPL
jgi:hypothetical protein